MISKSFKFFLGLLIIILFSLPSFGEEEIDIWKNKKIDNNQNQNNLDETKNKNKKILSESQPIKPSQLIKIEDGLTESTRESKVFASRESSQNSIIPLDLSNLAL